MYDDWGNEIATDVSLRELGNGLTDEAVLQQDVTVSRDIDWQSIEFEPSPAADNVWLVPIDDPFIDVSRNEQATKLVGKTGELFTAMNGADGAEGEADLGEIVVTAERPDDPWWDIDNLPGGGGNGSGGAGSGSGGGSSTPDQPDDECPSTSGLTPDEQARRSAASEGADIALDQNWQNQEYGGFVYRDRDTGEIRMGTITSSGINDWTPSADNMNGIYSYDQIIGILNTHGPNLSGINNNFPSTGDYAARAELVRLGAPSDLVLFILGSDGRVREYSAEDEGSGELGEDVTGCSSD